MKIREEVEFVDKSLLPRFVERVFFGWILLITGFISWIASGALVLDRLKIYEDTNAVASCDVNSWIACSQVMKTPEAAIFGFPNPLIGLVAFAVIITTGVVLIAGGTLAKWYWIGLQIGVTLGMVMIVWLWYQALYTIGILCPYCIIVWLMMIPLFILTTSRNIIHQVVATPQKLINFVKNWSIVAVSFAYLLVVSSILLRFLGQIVNN